MKHPTKRWKFVSYSLLTFLLAGILILPAYHASLADATKVGKSGELVSGTQIKLHSPTSTSHLPKPTPTPAATSVATTIEQKIKNALANQSSLLFQLSDDHVFSNNLDGFMTYKQDGKITKTPKSAEWAKAELIEFSKGITIRIDGGVASMQDTAKYTCAISVLPGSQGVSLEIHSVGTSPLDESIVGIIQGNSFTASQVHNFATYSAYTKTSRGYLFSGDYRVSLVEVLPENAKPQAVTAHYNRNEDYSVTISWEDPNPTGTVAYYEIYRVIGIGTDYTLAATVSNCSSWTDTLQKVKDSYWDILNYYVVAYNSVGVASEISNILVF